MSRPPALVLMYHGVDRVSPSRDPHAMFVPPATFRAQIEHLLESGFVPVSEEDYLAAIDGAALPRKAVLITFDDGYIGVGEHAAPVLSALGVPSILYVPSGLVGGWSDWLEPRHRHPLMSADDLRAVHAQGMAIGAHGFDHADLTGLSRSDLGRHTLETRHELESLVGDEVRSFAFPYGTHDARARAAVRAAGFRAAFAVHDRADEFALRRVDVNALDTMRTFRLKLRRFYPSAWTAAGRIPAVRRLAHDVLGRADRAEVPDATVPGRAR